MTVQPPASPSYGLFGHAPAHGPLVSYHVERISSRRSVHDGNVEPHHHPHLHQLTYWTAGSGSYVAGTLRHDVVPGLLCWMPAGNSHGFQIDAAADAIVLSLDRERTSSLIAGIGDDTGEALLHAPCVLQPVAAPASAAARLFAMAEAEYTGDGWGCQDGLGAIVRLILIDLGRRLQYAGLADLGQAMKTPLFRRFETHVEANFRAHPTVDQIAASLATTPFLLNRACRTATGLHVSAYVRRRILREAERLLLFTMSEIGEVAYLCGFADRSHFTRTFRQARGETPSAWRDKAIRQRAPMDQASR
jgi:AraC family transcriptional activator of pobA